MNLLLKRLLDLFISIIALIVLSPILILCIIILRFTGEGEVFYFQERLGFLNSKFFIIKFATMLKNSPNIGSGSITVRNDPRVLPFGNFLRKTKINELPQIINVLKGEMSIVGPRPQMKVDFEKFPEVKRDEIYKSKHGITGMGSIVFRDEQKWISNYNGDKHVFYKEKIAPYKTDLELWYLKNQSFLVDLKLILITALVIVFPKLDIINKFFKNVPRKPSHLN